MHIHLIEETDSLLEIMACVFVLAVFHGGEMCEEVQCLNFRVNVMLWRQTQDLWGRSHLRGIAVLAGASSRITTFKTHWRQFTDRLKEKEEREGFRDTGWAASSAQVLRLHCQIRELVYCIQVRLYFHQSFLSSLRHPSFWGESFPSLMLFPNVSHYWDIGRVLLMF